MQTFLTHRSFSDTAAVLDSRRLNKQLLEGRQILGTIVGKSKGWKNHPAVKMWTPSGWSLVQYLYAIRIECDRRGIKTDKNWAAIEELSEMLPVTTLEPVWLSKPGVANRVFMTHRAMLYKKDPVHYEEFAPYIKWHEALVCCKSCNYAWPSHLGEV